jgi:hypothetical protein
MKKVLAVFAIFALVSLAAATEKVPPLTKTLNNARFVYVASYDGDQFNPNVLLEDRRAIAAVQDAIQKSGKFILVYRPGDADIVMLVQSRPTEDVLAVYDGHTWPRNGTYLWRVMGAGGLQKSETPFVTEFLQAFAKASAKS